MQGVEKLLEYLAPLGQKSAMTEGGDVSSGENTTYDVRPLILLKEDSVFR